MTVIGAALRGIRGLSSALLLAGLLVGAQFAPATMAHANPTTDKIKECLTIGNAVVDGVEAGVNAAAKIAEALADPTNAACMGEASSGNPVTIGFMAAMTGIFAALTADGEQPFHDAEGCNKAIKDTLAGLIGEALNGIINSGLAGDVLKSILPDAAVDLIQQVASQVATGVSTELADALIAALGPVGHYLQCGCAAAGVAAIVYDGAVEVADAGKRVANAADACGDLIEQIWDDPKAFAESLIENPGAVVNAAVEAVCGLHESTEAVCGAAKVIWEVAAAACEETGVCQAAAAFYEGVSEVGETLACIFSDCSEPSPPTPPPPCAEGQQKGMLLASCSCTGPNMGWVWEQVVASSSLYGGTYLTEASVCRTCKASEGKVGDSCVKCSAGFQQDPATGQCSKPLICPAGAVIKPDNTGCMACPAGTRFGADGRCTPDCAATPWLSLKPGYSNPPAGYYQASLPGGVSTAPWGGGTCSCPEGQYNNGSACVTALICPEYTDADNAKGTCTPKCAEPNKIWDTTVEVGSCKTCPDGKVSVDNKCVDACETGEIRAGNQCIACPEGTSASDDTNKAGESLACGPTCRPGSAYAAPPPASGGNVGYDISPGTANGTAFPPLQVVTDSGGQRQREALAKLGAAAANPGQKAATGAGAAVAAAAGAKASAGFDFKQGGTGRNNAGGAQNSACRPCAANERYVTMTTVSASGNAITQGACMACPAGQVASRNNLTCGPNIAGLLAALRPKTERREPPPVRATPAPAPRQPPVTTTPSPAPRAALRCPPGRVPNAAGTACIVDLGDFGSGGGRANTPSGGGSTTTPYRR